MLDWKCHLLCTDDTFCVYSPHVKSKMFCTLQPKHTHGVEHSAYVAHGSDMIQLSIFSSLLQFSGKHVHSISERVLDLICPFHHDSVLFDLNVVLVILSHKLCLS